MSNPLSRLEARIADAINVAFFYRAMAYLILTVYAFVLVPIERNKPIFPNPEWFIIHLLVFTSLILLSQANHPNHLQIQEAGQRVLVGLLPPALFFLSIKQRWYDLKILIKRDKYGSLLLFGVLGSMGLALIIYVITLFLMVIDFGFYYLLFTLFYTFLLLIPMAVIDLLGIRKNTTSDPQENITWEQGTVRGEPVDAVKPFLFRLLNTKRKRLWVFIVIIIIYGILVGGMNGSTPPPITT